MMKEKRIIKVLIPLLVAALTVCLPGCRQEAAPGLTVYAFSAGAADSFLITTASSAVMIDCGEKDDGSDIARYLAKHGISRLDRLIITHFDKDHIGGVPDVLSEVSAGQVLQSDTPKDSKTYERYVKALSDAGITPGTLTEDNDISFELDGAVYRIDAPKGGYEDDESNNSSLIISVTYEGRNLLFMGDAEDERISEYLSDEEKTYDLLKVPHHGRSGDMMPSLIDTVKPKVAIITSSEDEPEDEDVVEYLREAGAEVYLTREGPVITEVTSAGVSARYDK